VSHVQAAFAVIIPLPAANYCNSVVQARARVRRLAASLQAQSASSAAGGGSGGSSKADIEVDGGDGTVSAFASIEKSIGDGFAGAAFVCSPPKPHNPPPPPPLLPSLQRAIATWHPTPACNEPSTRTCRQLSSPPLPAPPPPPLPSHHPHPPSLGLILISRNYSFTFSAWHSNSLHAHHLSTS
jgi:hypothetical protein